MKIKEHTYIWKYNNMLYILKNLGESIGFSIINCKSGSLDLNCINDTTQWMWYKYGMFRKNQPNLTLFIIIFFKYLFEIIFKHIHQQIEIHLFHESWTIFQNIRSNVSF